jgi:nitrogen fixation NifU-like protein
MALEADSRRRYQQVILEQSKSLRHRGKTAPIDRYQRGHIPACGDAIEITLKFSPSSNRIEDIKFDGYGCALSMASADLMAETLVGKTPDQALGLIQQFEAMMRGEGEFPLEFRKLNILQGIAQAPARIKCAALPWHTLKIALQSSESA